MNPEDGANETRLRTARAETGEGRDEPRSSGAGDGDRREDSVASRLFRVGMARICSVQRLRAPVGLAARVARGFREDRVSGLGAEVAFFAVLSVFPGLLALAAAVGWMDQLLGGNVARDAQEQVVDFLGTFLRGRASGVVEAVRELFEEGSAGALSVGLAASLWSASRGTAAVMRALGEIYDAEETRSRLKRRLIALALALGSLIFMAVMLVMLVVGPLLGLGQLAADTLGVGGGYRAVWRWLGLPLAFVALVAWAAVILHAAPHRHRAWKSELIGAATTGILWLAASLSFRLYLEVFGGNEVFGVLGGALVVLLWIYLLSLSLLVGGEVNAVLSEEA